MKETDYENRIKLAEQKIQAATVIDNGLQIHNIFLVFSFTTQNHLPGRSRIPR